MEIQSHSFVFSLHCCSSQDSVTCTRVGGGVEPGISCVQYESRETDGSRLSGSTHQCRTFFAASRSHSVRIFPAAGAPDAA